MCSTSCWSEGQCVVYRITVGPGMPGIIWYGSLLRECCWPCQFLTDGSPYCIKPSKGNELAVLIQGNAYSRTVYELDPVQCRRVAV